MAVNTTNIVGPVTLNGTEWHLLNQLGSGGFADVYLARSNSGEELALKFIPKLPGADRELLFEELNGVRNIIPILFRDEIADFWVIGMPKADKNLRTLIDENGGKLSVETSIQVLLDIANSLEEMRKADVVHRDIKPENVLLLNGTWCLADFGIARFAAATTAADTRKFAQTDEYAAPEQWRGERATCATDVYATGVIAYEMLAGRRPFEGDDLRSLHLVEAPDQIEDLPPLLAALISWCLNKAPGSRPTPDGILVQLQRSSRASTPNSATPLQLANQHVVLRQAETSRRESAIALEIERRNELFEAAKIDLTASAASLVSAIRENAPQAVAYFIPPGRTQAEAILADFDSDGFDQWAVNHHLLSIELNDAHLYLDSIQKVRYPAPDLETEPPFKVIASSGISVYNREHLKGYMGRSHSLWYCDALEEGRFRWFETGFMTNQQVVIVIGPQSTLPRSLPPGKEAYDAISRTDQPNVRALDYTPVDQSSQSGFVDRWITYFGDAANGALQPPNLSPKLLGNSV